MDHHHLHGGTWSASACSSSTRASGELRRHGLKIRLPDQSFQILRLLLSRPGEVVTREELRNALWTSETFVDFDVGLNSAIRKLREALDDSAENPRFVETLPRRGYRFIATVIRPAVDQTGESASAADGASTPSRPGVRAGWIAGGLLLTATIAALGVVYARGGFVRLRAGTAAAPIRSLVVLPFENLTGDAAQELLRRGGHRRADDPSRAGRRPGRDLPYVREAVQAARTSGSPPSATS